MSAVQKQDLIIFSDHSVLCNELFSKDQHHVFFVTHKLGTAPTWLISALMETRILGSPLTLNESQTTAVNRATVREMGSENSLTIASLIHNQDFFTSALNRLKVDPRRYTVVDYLTDFVLQRHNVSGSKVISAILEELTRVNANSDMLILEQPELLMPLLNLTSDELHLNLINPLIKKFPLLVIVSYTEAYDNAAPDYSERQSSDLIEQVRFFNSCFFKSAVVLGLKPLATGRAKDVTGTLTITRGGTPLSNLSVHVVENEYLFHSQKDSTKLFYR